MKTFFKVVLLILVVAFYSCGKDENVPSVESSITTSGFIRGTIVNYATSPAESITFNDDFIAKVSKVGDFSITLPIPKTPYFSEIGAMNGVQISDTEALISEPVDIVAYHNGQKGELMRTNITSSINSLITITLDSTLLAGLDSTLLTGITLDSTLLTDITLDFSKLQGVALSLFIYADREVTQKGICDGTVDGFTGTIIYDIKYKKGWNEIVIKIEKVSKTTGDVTMRMSNTIPSDFKWMYFKDDDGAQNVRSMANAFKRLLMKNNKR
jgi:hypothetical protein